MANISHFTQTVNGVSTTYDIHDANALTTEIDSMGTDWVRFKSGLQICYGSVTNISNVATGRTRFSFPVAFDKIPVIVATPAIRYLYVASVEPESVTSGIISLFDGTGGTLVYTSNGAVVDYVAIGKWK